jgi:hypothetical protein
MPLQVIGRGGLDDHLDLAVHDQLFVISDIGADDTGDRYRQCPDRAAAKQFFLCHGRTIPPLRRLGPDRVS